MNESISETDCETTLAARATGSTALIATLAACGGAGGKSSQSAPSGNLATTQPVSSEDALLLSYSEAGRFLAQASNGATREKIEGIAKSGIPAWLAIQFSTQRSGSYWDWLIDNGYGDQDYYYDIWVWERPLWRGLMENSDPLRQRITLALLDVFAVGIQSLSPYWRPLSLANYLDVIADNCFGTFREFLEAITYSTAMGSALTYLDSTKADAGVGRPDENYAREIMQLFTIGLHMLDQDGTPQRNSQGNLIPTYSQDDVAELSRVFTGMRYSSSDRENYERHRNRLVFNPKANDAGVISFLGTSVSGGGDIALSQALDVLTDHPNVGPFISRRLIQALVTSNPSPAYVRRVVETFNDNGSKKRGDLKAVINAILTDDEARTAPTPHAGKLRDPIQRFLNWGIAFKVHDSSNNWRMPGLVDDLAKAPGMSPTIFNFFRPNYSPPQTEIQKQGLVAPEFEIATEQTVISYMNFIKRAIAGEYAYFGLVPDFSPFKAKAKAKTSHDLVEELNFVLAADQLSPEAVQIITSATDAISGSGDALIENRIKLAAFLVMSSPHYLILE